MKKLLVILLLIIVGAFSAKFSFAQVPATTSAKVQYDLAYPGILPDSPFYKLKVLRDRIEEALISDPKQKIQFYLLQTDKGILATAILIDKHEIALAKETALKAENNYSLITGQLSNLDRTSDLSILNKLETAALKHQEVLISIINRVPKKDQETFRTVLEFSKKNLQKVEEFNKFTRENNS